jgi:hypothetical protein
LADKLRALGVPDKDIATLEGYGSVALCKRDASGVLKALTEARKQQVIAALEEAGLLIV